MDASDIRTASTSSEYLDVFQKLLALVSFSSLESPSTQKSPCERDFSSGPPSLATMSWSLSLASDVVQNSRPAHASEEVRAFEGRSSSDEYEEERTETISVTRGDFISASSCISSAL